MTSQSLLTGDHAPSAMTLAMRNLHQESGSTVVGIEVRDGKKKIAEGTCYLGELLALSEGEIGMFTADEIHFELRTERSDVAITLASVSDLRFAIRVPDFRSTVLDLRA